jgi:hypothetical protein
METYTKIAENIIAGISNNETIADLLLKAKIYASLKKDKKNAFMDTGRIRRL